MLASLRLFAVMAVTMAAFLLLVLVLGEFVEGEPLWVAALYWSGAFWLGFVFACWNLYDAVLDTWSAVRGRQSQRTVVAGFWFSRSDLFQALGCLFMLLAGLTVVLGISTPSTRSVLIFLGGAMLVVNQVWNRFDRERLRRAPYRSRAALMRARAVAIAALGRALGHDIPAGLTAPVGIVDTLAHDRAVDVTTRAQLAEAVGLLLALTERVHALHREIRDLDPSYVPTVTSPAELPHE